MQEGNIKGLADELHTNLETGLERNEEDLKVRREIFGDNSLPAPPAANWFYLFWDALHDPTLIILMIIGVLALVAGVVEELLGHGQNHWIEGVAILFCAFVVASVGASNHYSKDQQYRKLKKSTSDRPVRIVTHGDIVNASINDIVVGDIIEVHTGDKIPADGLFLPGFEELKCDESSMTGEPEQQSKTAQKPFLWSGTNITKGAGRMLVMQVGVNSEWGKTLAHLTDDIPNTPLQEKLGKMVILIGKVGVVVAFIVFMVLIGYYIDQYVVDPHKDWIVGQDCDDNNSTLPVCPNGTYISDNVIRAPSEFDVTSLFEILSAFLIGITIIVVAVPEGLSLAVTISLAYSMRLMAKDQNLVRHLNACEVMGGATNICSDKTGTLTQNKMTVVAGWLAHTNFDILEQLSLESEEVRRTIIDACCLNLEDAHIERDEHGKILYLGSTTECALLVFAEAIGADHKKIQSRNEAVWKWGFTSDRKRMSTVVANRKKEDAYRLYCKGAAEWVLKLCDSVLDKDGNVKKLDKKMKKELGQLIERNAGKGLRNISLAYRDFDEKQNWDKSNEGKEFEEKMVLIGIVSIEDPLRPEVPDAVRSCKNAGITVRMVTGDNILTAKKIAEDCGIYDENGIAMEGPEFRELSDEEVKEILPKLQVLARSSPTDKHRLVTLLKETGEVVAVTGDGTNDAPALRAADVGLAMGISGTEVAKEAADIIILDDNFSSIVKSVMWGRCVFDNIRKFIQFQLTVNVVALTIAFLGAVTNYGTPLTAVQLLWVNLIMDSLIALALGTEKPTIKLLNRKPYGRSGKIVTWVMWRNILGQSVLHVSVLCVILYATGSNGYHLIFPWVPIGYTTSDPTTQYTMIFNTFVWLQIFNEFNSRLLGREINVFADLRKNYIFISTIILIPALQAIVVEFGGVAIHTTPLDWREWLICIFIGSLALPWGLVLRFIPVRQEHWEVESVPI